MKMYFITDSAGHNIFGMYNFLDSAVHDAERKLDIEDEFHIHSQETGEFQPLGFYFDHTTLVKKVIKK